FPFYKQVVKILKTHYPDYKSWTKDKYYYTFVQVLLSEKHLNFSNLPKGVLPFHKQETPLEEHLKEAMFYTGSNKKNKVHFTVSEEHLQLFEKIKEDSIRELEAELDVSFSFQKKSTDTIAVHFNKT